MEERARRLQAEQQLNAVFQAMGTFSPSVLPPPPTHTPSDLSLLLHHHHRVTHLAAQPLLWLYQLLTAGCPSAACHLLHMKSTTPSCPQALPTAVISRPQR